MSAERPVNVADMIAWLRAHPGEPFFSLWSRDRLLIGTRNDTGEICAWDCNVQASKMEYDRRASPAPETRTADTCSGCGKSISGPRFCLACVEKVDVTIGAPETRTGEGAVCAECDHPAHPPGKCAHTFSQGDVCLCEGTAP